MNWLIAELLSPLICRLKSKLFFGLGSSVLASFASSSAALSGVLRACSLEALRSAMASSYFTFASLFFSLASRDSASAMCFGFCLTNWLTRWSRLLSSSMPSSMLALTLDS